MADRQKAARIKAELQALEKEANEERKLIREERENGVGLLTPALLRQNIRKGTGIVLAYGQHGQTVEFTLDDLKRFVEANKKTQKAFRQEVRGVPLALLEKNSLKADIERSKEVKSATLYKIKGNLLFFTVTGNSKPRYQVRIRLEDWNLAIHSVQNPLVTARMVATGRISFDCACGRHQYWYRYLTHIGGFDVNPPKEQDFPKIRNPGLIGCCCKHVLKVLRILKSNTVHAVLAKEIERQSSVIGFADNVKARFLSADEILQASRARGVSRNPTEATQAQRKFEREAKEFLAGEKRKHGVKDMQKRLKPRNKPLKLSEAGQKLSNAQKAKLIAALQNAKTLTSSPGAAALGFTMKKALENIAAKHMKWGITVSDLKFIMNEQKI